MNETYGCPQYPNGPLGYTILHGHCCLRCGNPVTLLEFTTVTAQ